MKNPFRYHTHAESHNPTLAVFFALALLFAILIVYAGWVQKSTLATLIGAWGCIISSVLFKLELAMFD